jgi:hypothetical protein
MRVKRCTAATMARPLLGARRLRRRRCLRDRVRQLAPGGVLRPDHRGQVDKLAGLLQLRQHEVLLQLLVVALDEAADDARAPAMTSTSAAFASATLARRRRAASS